MRRSVCDLVVLAATALVVCGLLMVAIALAVLGTPGCDPEHDGWHRATRGGLVERCECASTPDGRGGWMCRWREVDR